VPSAIFARIYTRINAANSDAALKWYRGFRQAILSLEKSRIDVR
jgi:hypothetical protein